MGNLKIISAFFALTLLLSCTSRVANEKHKEITEDKTEKWKSALLKTKHKYLFRFELTDYLKQVETIKLRRKYSDPFDSLSFNKVIAYDFDGRSGSKIVSMDGRYSTVVLKQQVLNRKQIHNLLVFLLEPRTYGETTYACFEPKMGIVFYQDNKVVFVVNICLDCNYLTSTYDIPATQFNSNEGYWGMRGFSTEGKGKIIELSKELGFRYGELD